MERIRIASLQYLIRPVRAVEEFAGHVRGLVESQVYTVGSLPMVPAVSLDDGQAAILTPSDFPFSRDGILAEGMPDQESMVIGELDLTTIQRARTNGTVLPLLDSARSQEIASNVEHPRP